MRPKLRLRLPLTVGLTAVAGTATFAVAVAETAGASRTAAAIGPTTSQEDTTTTSQAPPATAPPASLPITVSAWQVGWTNLFSLLAQLDSPGSLADFAPDPAGEHLYGSQVSDGAAIYLETPDREEPIRSVIVALAPGNTSTPARLISAVGSSVGDITGATDLAESFNEVVLPYLGTITQLETVFHVTDRLDLYILVAETDPAELLFVWLPAGETPSQFARDARYEPATTTTPTTTTSP